MPWAALTQTKMIKRIIQVTAAKKLMNGACWAIVKTNVAKGSPDGDCPPTNSVLVPTLDDILGNLVLGNFPLLAHMIPFGILILRTRTTRWRRRRRWISSLLLFWSWLRRRCWRWRPRIAVRRHQVIAGNSALAQRVNKGLSGFRSFSWRASEVQRPTHKYLFSCGDLHNGGWGN